jgi:RimJ/RimL family protein N-acetyltransferase
LLDLQPTLQGPSITMRPLVGEDFPGAMAAAADPEIWAQHPDPARATPEGFRAFFDGALQSKGCLVAISANNRAFVGWSRYTNYVADQQVDIGFTFLARSYWGGATNAEMKRLMLRHAFLEVPQVRFTVAEENWRSRRAVEKLGANLIGSEESPRWGQIHLIYHLTSQLWTQQAAPGYGP